MKRTSSRIVGATGPVCVALFLLSLPWSQALAAPDDYQGFQTRPISLGTSGGNVNDISRKYCCSGTLGALVKDAAGTLYILSNNHVLGRANQAAPGEIISQPGMIDQGCAQEGAVAFFSTCVPIQFWGRGARPANLVDAAIAEVITDNGAPRVRVDGDILGIGPLNPTPQDAAIGLNVTKSGRTTRTTTGVVNTVGATILIAYSKTCGGPSNQRATFADQMLIVGDSGSFSAGGDSGSLIVATATKRPVGLLFAGNSSVTVANPIGPVLEALAVSFVGEAPASPPDGGRRGVDSLGAAKAVAARHSSRLLDIPGVHGHGIGLGQAGPAIQIFVTREGAASARAQIPADLGGVPVMVVVTDPFVAF